MRNQIEFVLIVIVVVSYVNGFTYQRVFRKSEICGFHNGHRKYLELGESGELSATNITVSKNAQYIQEVTRQLNQTLTLQCTLELVTCPSCIIALKFSYLNLVSNCENPKKASEGCRCDFIILSEPPYDTKPNLVYNCGSLLTYQSRTRSVQIKFVYSNNYTDAFHLEYSAGRNREVIVVDDSTDVSKESVEISSPFFPALYPRDHSVEHVVTCKTEECRIRLIFSDFQISRSSSMEFYDTTGERLLVTGATFRPPVLISSGPSLMVRFFANGGSDTGYKAKLSFLIGDEAFNPDLKPRTGCGGMVDSVGGAITMMDMVDQSSNDTDELFDCIWIVRPPESYMHMKTHVSLRVENFEKMAAKSQIVILQGTTSDRPLMERLESSALESVSSRTLVVPITAGFYVRLTGKFNSKSRLAIVYTAFSYSKCYVGGEFLCENQRCIPLVLQCDGFNQCGDNSDEPESCPAEWARSIIDRRWYSHTPNYYFPKIERFTDIRTMAFAVSSVSLLFVISCLILTLYRNGNRVREQEELQNQLHTISQLLDGNNNSSNNRPEEITEPPPNYEEPPAYDEIIKVGMDEQITKSKQEKKRLARKHRLNRPRRSDPAVSYQSGLLEVSGVDDSDIASTSSFGLESPYFNGRNPSQDFMPSVHMIEITETPETAAAVKVETSSKLLEQIVLNSFDNAPSSDNNPPSDETSPSQFSSTEYSPRKHLWSNGSKFKRSWILFNSDSPTPDERTKASEYFHERDSEAYFKAFSVVRSVFNEQADDLSSRIEDTSRFNESSTLKINDLECERCKNLIIRYENRRSSLCGDCVEKFYSPKICSACCGRISFQDLKESSVQLKTNNNHSNDLTDLKLCNCFPKFPSQSFSSIHPCEQNEIKTLPQINGKSCSYNELFVMQQRQSLSAPFLSHNCLPFESNSNDESSSDED